MYKVNHLKFSASEHIANTLIIGSRDMYGHDVCIYFIISECMLEPLHVEKNCPILHVPDECSEMLT